MTVPINIVGAGNGMIADVTEFNELVAASVDYNKSFRVLLDADLEVKNLVFPRSNSSFIIDGVLITATRDVVNSGVTVDVYESDDFDSTTVLDDIVDRDLARQGEFFFKPNIIVEPGRFVNAVANGVGNGNVKVYIYGYRLPLIRVAT